MTKIKYVVTADAGPMVAGKKNPGEGVPFELTPEQAEHPLRLGHIRRHTEEPDGDGTRDGVSPAPRSAPMGGAPVSDVTSESVSATGDKTPAKTAAVRPTSKKA